MKTMNNRKTGSKINRKQHGAEATEEPQGLDVPIVEPKRAGARAGRGKSAAATADPVEQPDDDVRARGATRITPDRIGRASAAAERKLRELRRKATSASLLTFAQAYLPSYFRLAPSRMHRELAAILERSRHELDERADPLPENPHLPEGYAWSGRGLRLAVAAPRGHAKSSLVTLAFILWSICEGTETFIVIGSDTAEQACDLLGAVKVELEHNERLRTDYPEVCEEPLIPPKSERWRKDDLITRTGVRVLALGAEQKLRGRRNRHDRPSLVVLDDVENEDIVRSEDARAARWDWLMSSVAKCGTSATNIVVVGTILHPRSMLARLIDRRQSPSWIGLKYQAVESWATRTNLWDRWEAVYGHRMEHEGRSGPEAARAMFLENKEAMLEGTGVLWPELEDYYALMRQKLDEGSAPFAAEKQNDPLDLMNCAFREHEIQFWDDPVNPRFRTVEELLNSDPRRFYIIGACDPSLGKPGGDDSAIITLAMHYRTKQMYVIGADICRRRPDATLDAILMLHKMRKFDVVGVEDVQFQQFLRTELERRARAQGLYLRVKGMKQTADKGARIARLQPLLAAGHLLLSKRHPTLLNQMLEFPTGRRDDGPDALEMAVRMVETRAYGGCVVVSV